MVCQTNLRNILTASTLYDSEGAEVATGGGRPEGGRRGAQNQLTTGPGAAGVDAGSVSGTGRGLALTAEHVRLHGGRVWVEDAPDGGARFLVDIPTGLP